MEVNYDKLKNHGAWITSDGRCRTEIKTRIAQAKSAYQRRKTILLNDSVILYDSVFLMTILNRY
jgi:hypothetical protein